MQGIVYKCQETVGMIPEELNLLSREYVIRHGCCFIPDFFCGIVSTFIIQYQCAKIKMPLHK